MLFFNQGDTSRRSEEDSRQNAFFSTFHVRISIACLLVLFWLIWITTVTLMILTYDIWSLDSCWKWIECSVYSVLIAVHGLVLLVGTVGYFHNSTTLCSALVIPLMSWAGAVSGVVIEFWYNHGNWDLEYCLTSPTVPGFLSIWVFAGYAVIIITKYCDYLKTLLKLKRRTGFNVDVFKERVFGTPPIKWFIRSEQPRCADLSDSNIDDIFADYEPDVALY
ncbi:unnamed protein product [Cylicocyclus nassatus]|uniref:Uncharacterized protein n=1 Tax=Cylicocyclus nassatus TaxID=53992 RepID=A0AA36H2J7_CYLNA|nr:unnamed protein product [Cylicocyclus nassatus]